VRFGRPDISTIQLHLPLDHTHKYSILNTLCSWYRVSNKLNKHPKDVTARRNVCLTGNIHTCIDDSVRTGRPKNRFRLPSNRHKAFSSLHSFQDEYKTRPFLRQKETGADSQGIKWPVCESHHWPPAVPSSIMRGPVSPRPYTSSLSAALFSETTNLFSWYDAASLLNTRRHYCQVVFVCQHTLCEV
jgi:hypothetical protein